MILSLRFPQPLHPPLIVSPGGGGVLQVVTLIVWCAGRFFLYTSYYAIFGALFGVQNFGKMVAIDNTVNGLFGLLQLPLTQWGLHGLNGNFTALNLIQVPAAC